MVLSKALSSRIDINIGIILLSLAVGLFFKPDSNEDFNSFINFTLFIIIAGNVILFLNTTGKFSKSWVRYDTLFFLGFLIVHFQIAFLESIGIPPTNPSFVWINKKVVNYAVWLSFNAGLFWMLGYFFFLKKKQKNFDQILSYKVNVNLFDKLLLVLFPLFLFLVGKEFLSGSYDGGKNWGVGASYIFLLLRVFLYLRIIYFFINTKSSNLSLVKVIKEFFKNFTFSIILCCFVLIFMLSGDRGPVIEIGVLILGAYSIYQKGIRFSSFLLLIISGATFMTLIGLGRKVDVENRNKNIIEIGYENAQSSETGFNPTEELATSTRILYRAIDVVPEEHPYLYGSTLIIDIVGTIPFASGLFFDFFDVPTMYKSSSLFFTTLGQGKFYTYGEGSQLLADIYINLGPYGVIIVMFIFGYFISFLSVSSLIYKKHITVIIYLLLLTSAIYVNRSNLLNPLQFLFIAFLADKFLAKKQLLLK